MGWLQKLLNKKEGKSNVKINSPTLDQRSNKDAVQEDLYKALIPFIELNSGSIGDKKKEELAERVIATEIDCIHCGIRFKLTEGIEQGPKSSGQRIEIVGCPYCHGSILAHDLNSKMWLVGRVGVRLV